MSARCTSATHRFWENRSNLNVKLESNDNQTNECKKGIMALQIFPKSGTENFGTMEKDFSKHKMLKIKRVSAIVHFVFFLLRKFAIVFWNNGKNDSATQKKNRKGWNQK